MTGTQVRDGVTELRTSSVSVLYHLPSDTGWEIGGVSWAFSILVVALLIVTKTGPAASLTHRVGIGTTILACPPWKERLLWADPAVFSVTDHWLVGEAGPEV